MERMFICLACVGLTILATAHFSSAQDTWATIRVNVEKPAGKVNPWIFGNNMLGYQTSAWRHAKPEHSNRGSGIWNPEERRSVPEMVAMARNIGLSISRYPGGCGVHCFDWKKTVGPVGDRPDQQFGLPEFLQNCADIGAEPLITIADYFGTAQDAADMVAYLNAPDDGKNRWAALRAADGRATPWNVIWFEYGNETEHGDHRGTKMTAKEYAQRYHEYRSAMRSIDPRIKLGAVISTGFPKLNEWARPVLEVIGKEVDFVIHHSYKPLYSGNDGKPDAKTLLMIGLAGADQIQAYYDEMNALLREVTGRADIPIAVTEFNGHFVQAKPVPYRHCLGNALIVAEMLRVFMHPRNNIIMANFWQFANEYWGAVKGYTWQNEPLIKRPQYYPFELYHQHFGPELLEVSLECASYETDGGFGVAPARGKGSEFRLLAEPILLSQLWQIGEVKGITQTVEGDVLRVAFTAGEDVNYYHAMKRLPSKPATGYRLSGWIKTEDLSSSRGACFQIGDARGYTETKSANTSVSVTGTTDWTKVEVDYIALPDAQELSVMARRISGGGPVTGRAFYRDLCVQQFVPKHFPAVPYLAANASRSADGKKVYVMVVNKHLDAPLSAKVQLAGFKPQRAKARALTGPAAEATNESDPRTVTVADHAVRLEGTQVLTEFPPHSLTAIALE